MPQLFGPVWNSVARASVPTLFVALGGALWLWQEGVRSDWYSGRDLTPAQPVPFSHEHHVSEVGLDCRLCHRRVLEDANAGIPAADVCLICHGEIWQDAAMLAPVRASGRTRVPLRWSRVYDLPDYVYFHHAVHVRNGVGCSTCHGRVDRMLLTRQVQALQMRWCIECHRDPAPHLRAADEIFVMDWAPPADQAERGPELLQRYGIRRDGLTDCGVCHR